MEGKNSVLECLYPVDLSLDENRWPAFRDAQKGMIEYALFGPDGDGGRAVTAIGAPTGCGKSLAAVALGRAVYEWRGWRTAILTATRALEDQYALRDFPEPTLIDIRGRDNYRCIEVDGDVSCKDGEDYCAQGRECCYRRQVEKATDAPVVLTNYQYWLNVRELNRSALGEFQMVICDEAHAAPEELGRFLGAWVGYRDLGPAAGALAGTGRVTDVERRTLAGMALRLHKELARLEGERDGRGRKTAAEKRLDDVLRTVGRVVELSKDAAWLWRAGKSGINFDPVWPGRYARRYIGGGGLEKLVLMSATLRPKTLALMGMPRTAYDFREWPRQFPPQLSPVYYWPVARLRYKQDGDWPELVRAVREILAARNDRKALVQMSSYDYAKRLANDIAMPGLGIKLCNRGEVAAAAEEFRRMPTWSALVSPSHGTGFDFAGVAAEVNIIGKLTFSSQDDPLKKARAEDDADYALYETATDLEQRIGRTTRNEQDRSESFILDKSFGFLRARAREHFTRGFRVYDIQAVPKRPPKL